MKFIPENEKQIWRSDISHKEIDVTIGFNHFTNNRIESESLEIVSKAEDGTQVEFVGCISSMAKISIYNLDKNIIGERITIAVRATEGENSTEWMNLFEGYVAEVNQASSNDVIYQVVAFDVISKMLNVDVGAWYESLSFPMTIGDFRARLAAHLMIYPFESTELPMDDIVIGKTISAQSLSLRDVLKAISQINGCFVVVENNVIKFKRLGRLEYRPGLAPSNTLYPSFDLYPHDGFYSSDAGIEEKTFSSLSYKDYDVRPIDKVIIREDSADVGAIFGDGTNAFVVEGNFFFFGKSASELGEIAERVFENVKDYSYTPITIHSKYSPWIDLCDGISVSTRTKGLGFFAFSRTIKGIQNMTDTFECEHTESRAEQINTVNNSIIQLRTKTNKLTRTVEQMTSEIYDDAGNSRISQNASQISACVTKSGGDPSSFGWELQADSFILKSQNKEVFKCNKDGILIEGWAVANHLESLTLRTNAIETNMLTASNIDSKTFTLGSGHIGNLDASKITSGTINADRINTSKIIGVSGDPVDSAWFRNVHATNTFFIGNVNYVPKTININGTNYVLLCSK